MKKPFTLGMSTLMLAGSLFTGISSGYAMSAPVQGTGGAGYQLEHNHQNGSLDLAVVNDEKLIESFIKRGWLSKNATQQEKQTFLKNYLELKGKENGVKEK